MLFLSGARGSALAVVVAIALLAVLSVARLRGTETEFRRSFIATATAAVGVAALVFIAAPSTLISAQEFVWSGQDPGSVGLEELINRMELVRASIANFEERPVFGIGFGITSYPAVQEATEFLGIPVSAPTEKGIILSSVLEETGIVGAMIFFALLWKIGLLSWRNNGPIGLGITISVLATNLGEATLLSLGAMGMYVWLVIGLGALVRFDALADGRQATSEGRSPSLLGIPPQGLRIPAIDGRPPQPPPWPLPRPGRK
jgi:hypothetical protein